MMYPDTHERINTLKRVFTNDNLTIEVKKIYLVGFIEAKSLNKLAEMKEDEEKFEEFKEKSKKLPDEIRFKLLEWSSNEWRDLKASQLREIVDLAEDKLK